MLLDHTLRLAGLAVGTAALSIGAEAAVLTNYTAAGQPVVSSDASPLSLSATGTTNWAAWNSRSNPNPAVTSLDPFASKTGGVGTISSITIAGTSTNVRGTASLASYTSRFTWADGSAAVPADKILAGVFSTSLDTVGAGVALSITGLAPLAGGQFYLVTLFGASFLGQGTVTATSGALTTIQLGANNPGGTKSEDYFQFAYNPDASGDTLNLSYILTTQTAAADSSHVLLQGVAISIVPEPSSALLVCIAGLGMAIRRRRA